MACLKIQVISKLVLTGRKLLIGCSNLWGKKKKGKKKSFAYKINNLIYENKHYFKKAISILSEQWEENKLYTVSW